MREVYKPEYGLFRFKYQYDDGIRSGVLSYSKEQHQRPLEEQWSNVVQRNTGPIKRKNLKRPKPNPSLQSRNEKRPENFPGGSLKLSWNGRIQWGHTTTDRLLKSHAPTMHQTSIIQCLS